MQKIKYLYIPIGGIGSRLKKDKNNLVYSSKCFLKFNGKNLLERIIENCKEYCEEIIIVYCIDEQYKDAYEMLGDCFAGMKVHYKRNYFSDPYVAMDSNGDCLAYMGDSYMVKEHFNAFINHVMADPILSFLRLDPKVINQKCTYYHYDGEYIDKLSYTPQTDFEHFEIGQLIYFPKEIVSEAVDLCLESDPLMMLHTFIGVNSRTCCMKLPCYNINDGKDYDMVARIIEEVEE